MRPDASDYTFLEQGRFDGGMNYKNPGPNQYKDSKNVVIRDGYVTTRPGIRRYMSCDGFVAGFWFNQEHARYNDATHTGFWFPFEFIRTPWGTVQGCALIRLSSMTENKIIFMVGGVVFIYERGYVTEVATEDTVASTETVEFVQGDDQVLLFRSDPTDPPMVWDGGDDGFVRVPDATVGDDIPHAPVGVYHLGRVWVADGDDVYASGVLEFDEWDYTRRMWSISKGITEPGVSLFPFHDDTMLCFKKNQVIALRQVNAVTMAPSTLADYVTQAVVSNRVGAVSRHAIVSVGEDVWFLGYGGIYSIFRNEESKMMMEPTAWSEPIQPYIDRINWPEADCACAVFHNNYVLFAVPVDGSTTNNMVLVYDRLANGGQGAWVGPWTSDTLNPVRFFRDNERLLYLANDNVVRQMFTNDPWDSESPYADTPQYDATKLYQYGELVGYEYNGDRIWRCIATTIGTAPPDASYWEEVTDQREAYDIETMVETRQFEAPATYPPLRWGRSEVRFQHQRPRLSLQLVGRDHNTITDLFTDQEYSNTRYDVQKAAWQDDNANLDFNDPHREDYSLLIGEDGMYIDTAGIYAEIWESHSLRFIPMVVGDRSLGLKLTNTRGKVRILGVCWQAGPRRFAGKKMA